MKKMTRDKVVELIGKTAEEFKTLEHQLMIGKRCSPNTMYQKESFLV